MPASASLERRQHLRAAPASSAAATAPRSRSTWRGAPRSLQRLLEAGRDLALAVVRDERDPLAGLDRQARLDGVARAGQQIGEAGAENHPIIVAGARAPRTLAARSLMTRTAMLVSRTRMIEPRTSAATPTVPAPDRQRPRATSARGPRSERRQHRTEQRRQRRRCEAAEREVEALQHVQQHRRPLLGRRQLVAAGARTRALGIRAPCGRRPLPSPRAAAPDRAPDRPRAPAGCSCSSPGPTTRWSGWPARRSARRRRTDWLAGPLGF